MPKQRRGTPTASQNLTGGGRERDRRRRRPLSVAEDRHYGARQLPIFAARLRGTSRALLKDLEKVLNNSPEDADRAEHGSQNAQAEGMATEVGTSSSTVLSIQKRMLQFDFPVTKSVTVC